MKRTRTDDIDRPAKKSKTFHNMIINYEKWTALDKKVSGDWVSATKTKNYLLKDPVLDWLEKYYLKIGYGDKNISYSKLKSDKEHINTEMDFLKSTLFKKGNEFESMIYGELVNKLGANNVVSVINNYTECKIEKMQDTIKYMQEGVAIITQAVLYNENNKTFGIADMLIRSDYINRLFDDDIVHISPEEETIGCKFASNYHYRVIDIKWSQLQLCSNGYKILNTDRYPAYKGQLAIYNLALGKIQNYIPNIAYILGKSYKYEFKSKMYYGNNAFNRMGHILYNDFDNMYIDMTKKAIDWYRDMYNNGMKWNLITDTRIELCPNMCNNMDAPYTTIKHILADKRYEITSLWRVGVKNRQIAYDNNIYNWMDDKCSANILGVTKNIIPVVDTILHVNKTDTIYSPNIIKSTMYDWRNMNNYVDFFIDFETINDVFYKDNVVINMNVNTNYIFMVGVGHYDMDKKWIFKEFHMERLNNIDELQMMTQFRDYIYEQFEERKQSNDSKIRFFHWSSAETTFLESFNMKNKSLFDSFLNKIEFADLYKLFISEPICINGCMSFKLKDVSKSMYRHGMIRSTWDNSNVSNGMGAMLDGCTYYRMIQNNTDITKAKEIMNNIISYNMIDCKVLCEILDWMRTKL